MKGFVRVAVASPLVDIGNPSKNAENVLNVVRAITKKVAQDEQDANPSVDIPQKLDIIVFPELCMTGYTCGDLFKQQGLLEAAERAVAEIAGTTENENILIFVGAPVAVKNKLFNCAVAICKGKILGVIPKQNIPNYNEFYESRWFRAGDSNGPKMINFGNRNYFANTEVPFGVDLMFKVGKEAIVHAEICEDLWMPIPPSSHAAIAGANILVNLSASNETVAKDEYRNELVKNQSGRCMAAYLYSSAGPSESTSDVVFGGACIIAENGSILQQSDSLIEPSFDHEIGGVVNFSIADIDVQKLQYDRRSTTSFGEAARAAADYRIIDTGLDPDRRIPKLLLRKVNGLPFVPQDKATMTKRCRQIFAIQSAGLEMRLRNLVRNTDKNAEMYIGISGGLDSTLALLVAAKACANMGLGLKRIHGITMPGFGTTDKTKRNAIALMEKLGVTVEPTIDIRPACMEQFKAIGHKPFGIDLSNNGKHILAPVAVTDPDGLTALIKLVPKEKRQDLVFENVQARQRTMILMSKGFVVGTGDLSEAALGWCTYNGDHMSMYNPNCSIPKTLVKFLVEYVAKNEYKDLEDVLMSIVNTTISPELLPAGDDGEIAQSTEDVLGPYILHDFYLFNFIRNGFSPRKILELSDHAYFGEGVEFDRSLRIKTLKTFIKRFFGMQFKRNCVPDGPKVGSVSLSPRGDWRMPSDGDPTMWLRDLQ